jgi:hypothetical protein
MLATASYFLQKAKAKGYPHVYEKAIACDPASNLFYEQRGSLGRSCQITNN